MKTTTLVTFILHHPTAHNVELMGSWDNFSQPWEMVRDNRRGRGHWTGCHTFRNIVCDGDASGIHERRDGALKMGGTYWYYYRIDYYDEYYDPNQPSTSSCPLLPGQYLNVLEVPWEKRFVSRSRSSSVSLVTDFDPSTLNPEDRYITPKPAPRPKLPKLMTKLSKLDPPMFGSWSAAPPKTMDSMMGPVREITTSASAPEEIYQALEGSVLPYGLPGVGGRGRSIKIHSRQGSSYSSNSSTSYGPPALQLAIPGSSRLRRSPSEAAIQFRDPYAPSSSSSLSSQQAVPWRSESTRSAPHPAGTRPQYVPYAPPPRRAATAPAAATAPQFHRRAATAPGKATRPPAYVPGEYVPIDGYESVSSGSDAHAHRRACSHESGLGLTIPPSLRAGNHGPLSPEAYSAPARVAASENITPQLAKARYFAARGASEPLESIPQSPGLSWQVGRVGEDDDEQVVVVGRGGEKLFVVNADEEQDEWRSKSAGQTDSSHITMAMRSTGPELARSRSTDSLYSMLPPAGTRTLAGVARGEPLSSILPPLGGDAAAGTTKSHNGSRSGSTSSTRPDTAVPVRRKPVAAAPERLNVNKDLPALPSDLMPSPLFSSTAAVLSAMESDDSYYAIAADYDAEGAASHPRRPSPPRLKMPSPPSSRDDFDWSDVVLSRFSIASQDDAPSGPHMENGPPGPYARSSSEADDTDSASLAARSSNADDDDAASASTFSVAPSGAGSASASPRAGDPGFLMSAAPAAGTVGGPVRKPSSRNLRAPPMMGGGKGKGKATDAGAGLKTARQAVAQMQQLLDEFEYLGTALI